RSVNQRNLHDFSINHKLGAELIGEIDRHAVKVIESGITTVEQVAQAAEAGFDAMLVGEALVRDSDPAAGAARFVAAGRAGA
ncbi:MAG: indole-3-glycerol-phosphate synthase TrpC, partial [Actinomycetota bacterium]|nr:indole-3-glycerol-phosphate synthase TrpC [Actinomycetota bacterium]